MTARPPNLISRFLNTLFISKDGHFGLQRFSKVDDPDDVSLLSGMGLFPPDGNYNEYVRTVVAYSEEVSDVFVGEVIEAYSGYRKLLAQISAPSTCRTRLSSRAVSSLAYLLVSA